MKIRSYIHTDSNNDISFKFDFELYEDITSIRIESPYIFTIGCWEQMCDAIKNQTNYYLNFNEAEWNYIYCNGKEVTFYYCTRVAGGIVVEKIITLPTDKYGNEIVKCLKILMNDSRLMERYSKLN